MLIHTLVSINGKCYLCTGLPCSPPNTHARSQLAQHVCVGVCGGVSERMHVVCVHKRRRRRHMANNGCHLCTSASTNHRTRMRHTSSALRYRRTQRDLSNPLRRRVAMLRLRLTVVGEWKSCVCVLVKTPIMTLDDHQSLRSAHSVRTHHITETFLFQHAINQRETKFLQKIHTVCVPVKRRKVFQKTHNTSKKITDPSIDIVRVKITLASCCIISGTPTVAPRDPSKTI